MGTIAANLQAVYDRIQRAAHACERDPAGVSLVAVSKNCPAHYIEAAHAAGQAAFGESYAQEGVRKITELAALRCEWHFIGPIQSNKTRTIAEHFGWVHSVDRERIAKRLSDGRPADLAPLQVCIQVNVSGETSKSGIAADEAETLARAIAAMPRLRLRGLMAIPEPTADVNLQRERFRVLRRLEDELNANGYDLDTLSMGMSDDLEAAIAEGATIVRVGTAIFGERNT
jgi:pyridoxal phosphate enzyme (YggS family)